MDKNKKIRICIVGVGAISRQFHIPAILSNENLEIISLVDKNIESIKKLGNDLNAEIYPSVEDVTNADLCFIATPPSVRKEVIFPALEKGMHVFSEKPLTYNWSTANQLAKKAYVAKKKLMVGQTRRFFPNIRLARNLLKSQIIQPPYEFIIAEGGPFNWAADTAHLSTMNKHDKGIIHDVGAHLFDLLQLIISDLNIAADDVKIDKVVVDREDIINNCFARISFSENTAEIKMSRTTIMANKFVIRGKNGSIITRPLFDKSIELRTGYDIINIPVLGPSTIDLYNAFDEEWTEVYNYINNDNDSTGLLDVQTILPSIKMIDRIIDRIQIKSIDESFEMLEKGWF